MLPSHFRLKIPLQWVLTIPFVLLTVGATGLVGTLSYQSGQQAVENLAFQLLQSASARVNEGLKTRLQIQQQGIAVNYQAFQQGNLSVNNWQQLQTYLWQQMLLSPTLGSSYFSNPQGEQIGYGSIRSQELQQIAERLTGEKLPIGTRFLMESKATKPGKRNYFLVDKQGKPKKLIYSFPIDNRTTPWFRQAKATNKQTWSPVYLYRVAPTLGLTALVPLRNASNHFQGLFASDMALSEVSTFLSQLQFSPSGQVLILERSGEIVATSTLEPTLVNAPGKQPRRLSAIYSQDVSTRTIAQHLRQRFGDLGALQHVQQLDLFVEKQRQFIQVSPYQDQYGLDWLIVTMVPESDFMADIYKSRWQTLVLAGLTMLGATVLGALIARRIAEPIQRLSRVSAALAEGTWQESLKEDSRITELSLLAHSFNRTAEQLQQSFDRIKTALQESEEKFTTIFRTSPDSIALTTIDDGGRYVEVNDSFLKLTGYDRQEVIGRTTADLNLSIDPQQDVELLNLLQQQGAVQNFEYHYRSKAGDLGTALISFQVAELDGQPHVLTVARDISDRKQLEEALQISEAKVTDILNSAIASISSLQVFSDGVWRLNHISAGCEVISGYTPEELIADPDLWVSRIVPTDWQVVAPEIYANLFAEQTGTYEYRFRHKDGSVRWFSQTNRSRWDEPQDCWFVTAVTSDISDRKQAEIALRQSEERFQQLAAASPGVIYTVVEDPEGPIRYEYLSPAFEDINEIPITEVLQDATLTFQQVHPEDRAAYQQAVAQSSQTMQPFRHAWRIITPAGQVKWIQANSRPERRPNGELVWHGIVIDITDRKQAEQKLQQALQELDTHFENSPLAIVQWNQEFRILRWSQQAERMFGWTADEVKHLSWQEWDFVYREDRDRVNAELAPLLHQAVTHQTIENRNYTKDGRVILCQWFTSAVFDNDGNLSSLLSFAEDITDRKQAEEILRQSEATNQALIRAIPDLMIRMHRDGTYLAVYPSNTVKLLHPEKIRPGITIFEMLPEEVANERMCYVEQVLEDGQVRTYEFQLMVEDDLRYEEARIVPCGPDEVLVIIRDISDRYQIDRLKDEFISVVSHELRTPLTAIRGSLGMLNMGVLDDEPETVKQMLQVALNSSDRLVRLVNDILDLERLESGKVQLVMEPCDADDLINQAVESVYPLAIQKQVKLEVLPISLDLWAAPDAIVQTLTNLLSNAIKFSVPGQTVWVQAQPILGEGGRNGEGRMKHGAWEMKSGNQAGKVHPTPTFRIQNHPPADSPLPTPYILFTVKDQGSGIPADKLETIFGRFQQVNVSDSRQKGGSGLGLAICKSIVQQHNGLIWAESEIGQGSCFYFTLPLSQP
jgi:PAS domain S-box-containing protein